MGSRRKLAFAATLFVSVTLEGAPIRADLVLRNGAIYRMDAARTWASAIAISGSKIVYVGTDSGVTPFEGPSTRVVDLRGRMVLPGFHDSHIHPVSGGMLLEECRLDEAHSPAEALRIVKEYRSQHRTLQWITGSGWDLHLFPAANPRREMLDAILPDVPVYLEALDGHSAWVNSRALEIAGVDKHTPDPARGRVERDPQTGEPTGTLRESAMHLVADFVPRPSPETYRSGLLAALKMAASFGITSLHDSNASEQMLQAYTDLQRLGELSVRVSVSLSVNKDKGASQIPLLRQLRTRYDTPFLRVRGAKLFIDGVLESHTAALLKPYLGSGSDSGTANYAPQELNDFVAGLDKNDFQVEFHTIGDRAVRLALDACEAAQQTNGRHDLRHHIAHIELIDPADVRRFAHLGVVADFEALWAYADADITELTEPVLGAERSRWLYAIRSIADSGAVVVGGSDWSVTSMNPLDAIQVGITRASLEGGEASWISEQRVDLRTMLAAYTINGAYAAHVENDTGSLEEGKLADLIVLDRNLFDLAPSAIHNAKVVLTMVGGRIVYTLQVMGI